MKKPINVNIKKKRLRKSPFDLEKLHQKQIDIIERFHSVYRLTPAMLTLWEIIFRSGELISGQLRLLRQKTGEAWYEAKYWKFRRKLEKELRR